MKKLPVRSFLYHLHTLYLFTASDFKTIVIPETAFGVLGSLSGHLVTGKPPSLLTAIVGTPRVLFWTWINLLPFAIDNQRHPDAIREDQINKPWRPLPSRRLTLQHAKLLMLAFYPAALLFSIYTGSTLQCLTLVFLGRAYNGLGSADRSCIMRNLTNAAGFLCYASGATIVASQDCAVQNTKAYQWFGMIGLVILSTVQMQDMGDQQGDAARGRKTVPLVVGDWNARLTIALPVVIWSVLAPAFWSLPRIGFVIPLLLGSLVSKRVLLNRTVREDNWTFGIWNVWMISLYLLPLVKG